MNKLILFLTIMSIFPGINAQDSTTYPYKNSIRMSPLMFANNSYYLNYERCIAKNSGLFISTGLYYDDVNHYFDNYYDYGYTTGYLGELQYRYYFHTRQGEKGGWNRLFFAPYALYRHYRHSSDIQTSGFAPDNSYNFKVNVAGAGTLLGYNLTIDRFSFEIFLGGGLKYCFEKGASNIGTRYFNHLWSTSNNDIGMKFGLNIGFTF